MPYLGNSPYNNVRQRFYYNATAGQTVFSGQDVNGITLKYQDGMYLDVYLNGVLLQDTIDYTALTKTSVTLLTGAALNDLVEIVAYGVFSVSDTVSSSRGGTFSGDVSFTGNVTVNGVDSADLGGGYFSGNNGDKGTTASLGDIFRVHTNTLTANVTIYSGNNALAAGPITVQTGKTLTIQSNARVSIV